MFSIIYILKRKDIAFIEASVLIISTLLNNVIKLIIRREILEVLKLVIEKSFDFLQDILWHQYPCKEYLYK